VNILAIIPARGGSKSIPKKNIKSLNGKPLIYYTISEAQKSKLITDIVLTSDNKEIIEVAKKFKCNTLKRSKSISQDKTPMLPVIKDTLDKYEEKSGKKFDIIVLLQPTTPFRKVNDIDKALKKLIKEKNHSIVSVYRVLDNHPARMYKLINNRLHSLSPKLSGVNRQNLPPVYHRNGAIYATYRQIILKNSLLGKKISYYEMSKEKSVNIDDHYDFKIANLIFKNENN
jgi:CMP-N-acetylneuraminic acid synthetase